MRLQFWMFSARRVQSQYLYIASVYYLLRSSDAFVQTSESMQQNEQQSISHRNVFSYDRRVRHADLYNTRYKYLLLLNYIILYNRQLGLFIIYHYCCCYYYPGAKVIARVSVAFGTGHGINGLVGFGFTTLLRAMTYIHKYIVPVAVIIGADFKWFRKLLQAAQRRVSEFYPLPHSPPTLSPIHPPTHTHTHAHSLSLTFTHAHAPITIPLWMSLRSPIHVGIDYTSQRFNIISMRKSI